MLKVHIINPNVQYIDMYYNQGWSIAGDIREADLVQFTGGEDVSPHLYGEETHPRTHYSLARDDREARAFRACLAMGKPMAGICRGGQFLNVMCGGKMYQHVDGHAIAGTHAVVDLDTGGQVFCTSTHHQMMRPSNDGLILGVASEARHVEMMDGRATKTIAQKRGEDVEVVYYEKQNALCFQPHPEYMSHDSPCQQWYFELINEHLLGD